MIEQPHNYYVQEGADKIDFNWVLSELNQTYFGATRTHDQLVECARNSMNFGIFRRDYLESGYPSHRDTIVGYARVVTDRVLFSWLADFVIKPELRGRGLGYQLSHAILAHYAVKKTVFNLGTRTPAFWSKFGFEEATHMLRRPTE